MADTKPVQIIGVPGSTCTRAAVVALRELNVPYELQVVDFAYIKSTDYIENKQPFGQIPLLVSTRILVLLAENIS